MGGAWHDDAHQRDSSGSGDAEGGKRPQPLLTAALRVAPCDVDHFGRLEEFRAAHPGVIIGRDAFETWCGIIPQPAGEQVVVRHTLGDLLDRLGELGLHAVPDG